MAFTKYISLLLIAGTAKAQSFSVSDLFGQAKKQKNYYMQQIAAYDALKSEIKMGYTVCKKGLSGIASINLAELNSHTAFYHSLKTPSSAVKNSTLVREILNDQADITTLFSQTFSGLTRAESNYVAAVKAELLTDCNKELTDLQDILAPGKLQLSDDERFRRLGAIHADMLDKYKFSQSFTRSIKLLINCRSQQANDTQTLQALYENH